MDQRVTFLSLILLDALEDENDRDVMNIIDRNVTVNPSYVPPERGISPMHYVCGMDNQSMGLKYANIFLERGADPNVCSVENITPLHVAAMHGRLEIVRSLLKYGAKLDIFDQDRKLPIHYAIEEYHFDVLQLMKDQIFLNKYERNNSRQQLAQSKVLPIPKIENLLKNKKSNSSTRFEIYNKHLKLTQDQENLDKFTPNRVHYNYDVASPYYINITHRRNKPQPKYFSTTNNDCDVKAHNDSVVTVDSSPEPTMRPVNIFTLTKENLKELSQAHQEKERSRISLIEVWRKKVDRSKARKSILREFDTVQEMIQGVIENDHLNFTNTSLIENNCDLTTSCGSKSGAYMIHLPTSSSFENLEKSVCKHKSSSKKMSLGQIIQHVAQVPEPESAVRMIVSKSTAQSDNSNKPVPEQDKNMGNPSNPLRSKNSNDYYLTMTEHYVHTDDEMGVVFYEAKLLSNPDYRTAERQDEKNGSNKSLAVLNGTATSQSTDITFSLDYDTDVLRAELTTFGEMPGPITKSTKRLYIKRLIKMKRKATVLVDGATANNDVKKIKFSVELQRSVRSLDCFQKITELYMKYDTLSAGFFANHKNKRSMREGHLKQSFIYMLIDPRISCNLPGECIYLEKFDVWKRFLDSIFYVGKGKTSRPYCHLYDAMKLHSRLHNAEGANEHQNNGKKTSIKKQKLNMEIFKKTATIPHLHSHKIQRILDIWVSNRGVVCLHIFHNIMPTDALTREASIIDALGLNHLTNAKRGDYYGPAKNWTMKEKKYLGIALLYKAMNIYLAEGESQLSPSDLI